ncbi:hypothetical protein [Terriglobus albidus]|uniref:hypothetical protein n=1 Tax=Terriglobus albidus TaxID=1592106 RepID=UPI0021E0F082|nr:hypothetical protein [Terriglobus albidus]
METLAAGIRPHHFEVTLHAHSVAGSPASVDCIAAVRCRLGGSVTPYIFLSDEPEVIALLTRT